MRFTIIDTTTGHTLYRSAASWPTIAQARSTANLYANHYRNHHGIPVVVHLHP